MRIALITSSLVLFFASPAAHARGGPMLAKQLGALLMREMERLLSVF
ncbi:hypothetical protein PQR62_21020 [Herbaspirillum lusitanum]|jgi:hypothetical protein|uniref:Uncharacterized protein n=1 Tax=Herbaspirillum lusitanum TaxID=213312 RepID=A0ABW9AE49_9BURK